MRSLAVPLLLIGVMAALFGFSGLAGSAAGLSKAMSVVFVMLSLLAASARGFRPSP